MRDLEAQMGRRTQGSIARGMMERGGPGATLEAPVIDDTPQVTSIGRNPIQFEGTDAMMSRGGPGATLEGPVISDTPLESALGRQTLSYQGSDGKMSAAVPQEARKQQGDLDDIHNSNVMGAPSRAPNPAFTGSGPDIVDASQFRGISGAPAVLSANTVNGYMQSPEFKNSLVRPTDAQMTGNSPVTVFNAPDSGTELAAYGALNQMPPRRPGEELQGTAFGVPVGKPGATVDLGYRDPNELPALNGGLRRVSTPSMFGYANPTPTFAPQFGEPSALFRQVR
jgi:hypothetical protein